MLTIYESEAEWLAARRKTIGASESSAVLGANKYRGPTDVYNAKVHPDVGNVETKAMRAGKALEAGIAQLWSSETGEAIAHPSGNRGLASWTMDGAPMSCTPDFLIGAPPATDAEGIRAVLEIKNCAPHMAKIPQEKGGFDGGPPLHYTVQVQHQMAVLAANGHPIERGVLAAYFGGSDLRHWSISPEPDLWEAMTQACRLFWDQHVLAMVPPPPDEFASSADLSRAWKRATTGKEAELDVETLRRYVAAKKEAKIYAEAVDRLEADLKGQMQDAEVGVCGGVEVIRWKETTQNRAAQEAKTITSRRWTVLKGAQEA